MPMVFAWLVGLVEFVGGIAVLLGMFFSIVAPLLALTMVAALLLVHTKMPYTAAELPIVLLGSVLALYATGAGKCALFRGKKDTCDCADASGDHEKCSTEDKDCCGGHCGCGDHEEHGHEEKKEHKAGM